MGQNLAARWIAAYFVVIPFAWRGFLLGSHSPFTSDIRHFHHPVTVAVLRALGDGHLPLWNDNTFLGFPMLADPQTAVFYPGTILIATLGPHWGYVLFLIAHSLLAAVGMFFLMRSHSVGNVGAWCAGLLVSLSGYYAHEAQHPGLFAILCWIPWWLLSSHLLLRNPSPLRAAGAAIVVAMMLFAGTLQVLFGAVLFYAFYVAGLGFEWGATRGAAAAVARLAIVFFAQVLGLAVAAVSLLPAVEHLPQTARALGMTYEFASMGSVHFVELIAMFVNGAAGLLGSELTLDHEGASFYLGSLALPLLIVGALVKRGAVTTAVASGVVALILVAMGRHGGLHAALFELSPDFVGGLRGMGRALGPGAVGIAFLAGVGIERLGQTRNGAWRTYQFALLAAIALHVAAWMSATTATPAATLASAFALLLALVAAGSEYWPKWIVAVFTANRNLPVHSSSEFWKQRVVQSSLIAILIVDLLAFGPLTEVVNANPEPPASEGVADAIPELDDISAGAFGYQGERVMLHGFGPLNLPLIHDLDGVGGYNPLVSLQYLDFINLINNGRVYPRVPISQFVSGSKPQRFESPLFDTASVRFVISNRPNANIGLRGVATYADSPLAVFGASLYENDNALPRAYLATRSIRAETAADFDRLLGKGFEGARTTVVEGEGPILSGPAEIKPVERRSVCPEILEFDVASDVPAILVVTDSWYPGWKAWVDGVESPVFRVNAMFRGVEVPVGSRRIEMRFEPPTFRVGAGISLVAVALIALLSILGLRQSRRSSSGAA